MIYDNSNFNSVLKRSGKAAYTVAKETGIPYTTLNEIINGKIRSGALSADVSLKQTVIMILTSTYVTAVGIVQMMTVLAL